MNPIRSTTEWALVCGWFWVDFGLTCVIISHDQERRVCSSHGKLLVQTLISTLIPSNIDLSNTTVKSPPHYITSASPIHCCAISKKQANRPAIRGASTHHGLTYGNYGNIKGETPFESLRIAYLPLLRRGRSYSLIDNNESSSVGIFTNELKASNSSKMFISDGEANQIILDSAIQSYRIRW